MPPADAPSRQTIGGALLDAVRRLRDAASPTPRLDAELLAAHVTGRDRSWVLAHPEHALSRDEAESLEAIVARRATGEPIAYIRGFKEWRSLRIRTDRRALIPRPETELLASAAIEEIERRLASADRTVVAWEVATGSGAVAVALGRRFADVPPDRLVLVASDVSAEALELAGENLAAQGLEGRVALLEADLLVPVAPHGLPMPDVVVANLPYVPSAEVELGTGSLAHEPRLALDGGSDGLDLVRRLIDELPASVADGATVLLELGVGQAATVAAILPAGATMDVLPDLAGIDRVVRIRLEARA